MLKICSNNDCKLNEPTEIIGCSNDFYINEYFKPVYFNEETKQVYNKDSEFIGYVSFDDINVTLIKR